MKISFLNYLGVAALAGTLFISNSAHAKVIVKKSTSYYSVKGSTGKEIDKSIARNGPKGNLGVHAIATTQARYDLGKPKFGVRGRKCVIEDIRVTVKIKYTIPRWKAPRGASQEVRKNWNEFSKLVIKHENKHGAIAEKGARDLEKEIKRLTGNVSRECRDFGRFASLKFARLARQISRKHRAFDRRESFALSKVRRVQKRLLKSN